MPRPFAFSLVSVGPEPVVLPDGSDASEALVDVAKGLAPVVVTKDGVIESVDDEVLPGLEEL